MANLPIYSARATPREIASHNSGLIWAGITEHASYRKEWLTAVNVFRANATNTFFIDAVTARPERLDNFIQLMIKRHGFTATQKALPEFLSQHQTYKRLYLKDKESLALSWIESLPDAKLRADVLLSQPWMRSILSKHGDRQTAKSAFNLLSGLETQSLASLLQNPDQNIRPLITEKMTKTDADKLRRLAQLPKPTQK